MKRKGKAPLFLAFDFLNLLLYLCSPYRASAEEAAGEGTRRKIPFDVGVVLDTESWIGNISWSCMRMAVDDFYAMHPGYSTRISFHLRDSGDGAVGSAVAAIDLLNNVQVKAIIGPQRSSQVKFVKELGERAQVPIISFSAKSPSLSSAQTSYFIRTAYNDSTQAKVITFIVKKFNWRQVVPVFVDDEYGIGILPCLINALQEVGVRVPYRSRIPPSATKDQILEELKKLSEMQTRVFVVHLPYDLGLQLFTIAEDVGMLKSGYVWITTHALTDIVDLVGSKATTVMQGVLGVRPFVNLTIKLRDFKQRWRRKFHQENHIEVITEPTVFGLWAYDTVWSLALAAEQVKMGNFTFHVPGSGNSTTDIASIGTSSIGPELLQFINNTEFDGMAGKFKLTDGQLNPHDFEILNVVGNGTKKVGFWTLGHSISGRINSKYELEGIIWPGGTDVVPKGWNWPTGGRSLKVGVPVKSGFPEFIRIEVDPFTKIKTPKGYCIDVFEAVMKDLPDTPYEFVLFEDGHGKSNGSYDELVFQVYLQNFDAVVGDLTITANRSLYVDFTIPYTESGVSMLVPVKDNREKNAWAFLEPITTDLWLSSGAFFIFTGFAVWLLEHRINTEFRGSPIKQLGTGLYFPFSTLVFAHSENVLSNLARIVVIVWLFVVLILQSSYTASLTSMLTVEQLQPTVTDLNDLVKNGDHVGYLTDSFMPSFLKRLNFNTSKLISYSSPQEYHDALSSGAVAAVVDEIPYLRIFLNLYCGKYTMIGPTYKTDGLGFVFPKNSPIVPDVSRAILKLLESDKMVQIEASLYDNRSCPIQEENVTNSSSLSFHSFWGLFLIAGVASTVSLVIYLAQFCYKQREFLQNISSETSIWRKIVLLAEFYDRMEPSSTNSTAKVKNELGEERVAGGPIVLEDIVSQSVINDPQTALSISIHGIDTFESEDGDDLSDVEELSGREISRVNPDPPSFADMLTTRNHGEVH